MMNFLNVLLSVALGTAEWKKNVLDSLDIMWKGVLAIFIVIIIVIIAVVILNKITASLANKKNSENGENN